MKHFCFSFNFRTVDDLLARFSRHSSFLRCSLHRLHVGVWRGILHNSRFPASVVLHDNSVLFHAGVHSAPRVVPVNCLVLDLFKRSRALHSSAHNERLVSRPCRCICTLFSRVVRLLWRFSRLDAELGTQQHGLVICTRLSRLRYAFPGWNSFPCRSKTFEVQKIKRDWQPRSCLLDGRQTQVRRSHWHLRHSPKLSL